MSLPLHTMNLTHELAKPDTLRDLVQTWQQAEADIRTAHEMVKGAEESLKARFAGNSISQVYFSVHVAARDARSGRDVGNLDHILLGMRREAWKVLVQRMDIKPRMSVAAAKELDKKLEGDDLPDITEENILGMLGAALDNLGNYMTDAVKEVFELLRPHSMYGKQYKTNTELEIGKRVILSYWVESRWNSGGFRVAYNYTQEVRALDNVFHLLDGQGAVKTHHGPLYEAIEATDAGGWGGTDYFKFRCCKNRSLHLEFKRMDLVQKLNEIAGGNRLKPEDGK